VTIFILGGGGAIPAGGGADPTGSLIGSTIISSHGFRDLPLGRASFACFLNGVFSMLFPPHISAPGPGGGGGGCWLSLETSIEVFMSLLLECCCLPFLPHSVNRAT
jgi:hypothetical protein